LMPNPGPFRETDAVIPWFGKRGILSFQPLLSVAQLRCTSHVC
jgi:hypothetical protein